MQLILGPCFCERGAKCIVTMRLLNVCDADSWECEYCEYSTEHCHMHMKYWRELGFATWLFGNMVSVSCSLLMQQK